MAKAYTQADYEAAGSPADLVIPEDVTEIGGFAFNGCSSLQSVVIPKSVTEIGYSAFSGCTSLETVTLLNSKINIDKSAFQGCTGITTVNLPKGLTWGKAKTRFKDSPWSKTNPN